MKLTLYNQNKMADILQKFAENFAVFDNKSTIQVLAWHQ